VNLDARKLGVAAAIVAALAWIVSRLLVLAGPFGLIRGGGHAARGYMMHGPMHAAGWHRQLFAFSWEGYLVGVVVGLIVVSLVAGIAAWGTAAIYNRLLARGANGEPPNRSSD
jgi:hypothetical protein